MGPVPRDPAITRSSCVCALIPHYGCERWLAQAVQSLLEQTRPPERIIVIDDASPLPPLDVVAAYPEVTLLGVDVNGGPYRLIQAVIDATAYDAYLFQDADDWSAPDRLEVLLDTAEHTGAALVGSHEMRVRSDIGDIVGVRYPLDVNAALASSPTSYPLLHPTSIVARAIIERLGGFATGMRFSGDAEMLRRAAHVARIVNADHHGYFRRKRDGSLTHRSDTAFGTPVRREVHAALAARARSNAALVAAGGSADLRPWRRSPPAALHHLAGPRLDDRPSPVGRLRRPSHDRGTQAPAAVRGRPVFVVGAPRSGALSLAWALGQHSGLEHVADGRWLARTCADMEVRARDDAVLVPAGFRRAAADALCGLAAPAGRRPVAAGDELLHVGEALASIFPDALFVHVVREPGRNVGAITAGPTEAGAYLTEERAWVSWLQAARDGLALEAALGSEQVLRVFHRDLVDDPDGAVRRLGAFVGAAPEPACAAALREMRDTGPVTPSPLTNAHIVDAATAAWTQLQRRQPRGRGSTAARTTLARAFDRRQRSARRTGSSVVERVRAQVCDVIPPGSTVAVVTRGDTRLVDLPERTGWHLPQVADGTYAGHHPADSVEAVAQLHSLRERGAEYLAIPAMDFWWLAHYGGFGDALDTEATLLVYDRTVGAVYRLAPEPVGALTAHFVAARPDLVSPDVTGAR